MPQLFLFVRRLLCMAVLCLSVSLPAMAQEDTGVQEPIPAAQTTAAGVSQEEDIQELPDKKKKSDLDIPFQLSIMVLGFGVLIILLIVFLGYSGRIDPENLLKSIILTLVIVSAMFFICAGYDNTQIAGVTGLLGSIAGYLLGKGTPEKKDTTEKK